MQAWLLKKITNLSNGNTPLELNEVTVPEPTEHEILIKFHAAEYVILNWMK